MEAKDLKLGDKVSYSLFNNDFLGRIENIKSIEVGTVTSIEIEPNAYGCDVAFVTGKSGCVDIAHLTKHN